MVLMRAAPGLEAANCSAIAESGGFLTILRCTPARGDRAGRGRTLFVINRRG